MGRLTKHFIESIVPLKTRYVIKWDDELKGFGVRVMASGIKTYIVSYRTRSGRQRRMSIGRCGVLKPAQARKRAIEILGEAALGGDPLAEIQHLRRESTFNVLAAEYIKRHASQKKSGREDIRIIRKDLLKAFGHMRLTEIGRRDIIRLINEIKDRGAPIMANRTLALIRKIFNFGIDQAMLNVNPCSRINPPGKECQRERVLSGNEIQAFWQKLPETNINRHVQIALKLVLVTAQRPGEVIGATWEEFDLDTGWWTIPAERSKNMFSHRVPLSPLALELIGRLERNSTCLFPTKRNIHKHIDVNVLGHDIRMNREVFGIARFTPHDLRRSAASHVSAMGVSRLVVAKILNHVESGITAVYDRYGYDMEKRAALDAWATKLESIVINKNDKIVKTLNYWTLREAANCTLY